MKKGLLIIIFAGLFGCGQPKEVKEMHFGPGPGDESMDADMDNECQNCSISYKTE